MKTIIFMLALAIILNNLSIISVKKKVSGILLLMTKEMSTSRTKIDSLSEEIGYFKGLQDVCFPVATK